MMSRILPILAFVIAVLVFFLYVEPTYSGSIAASQAAIASNKQALVAAAQYTAKENQLISAESQIDPAALAKLATFLPDSADDVGLILDLDALAAKEGLNLASIDVAAPGSQTGSAASSQSGSPYASIDLTLTATGTYSSFRSFLSSIEESARLLDVRDLSVKGSNTGVYTYGMTIRLYWLQ